MEQDQKITGGRPKLYGFSSRRGPFPIPLQNHKKRQIVYSDSWGAVVQDRAYELKNSYKNDESAGYFTRTVLKESRYKLYSSGMHEEETIEGTAHWKRDGQTTNDYLTYYAQGHLDLDEKFYHLKETFEDGELIERVETEFEYNGPLETSEMAEFAQDGLKRTHLTDLFDDFIGEDGRKHIQLCLMGYLHGGTITKQTKVTFKLPKILVVPK